MAFPRFPTRHPLATLAACALLTVALAGGMTRLELRTDGLALLPPGSPEVARDAEIRRSFGVDNLVLVLLRSEFPEGIYSAAALRTLDSLTVALRSQPGIDSTEVLSLATEPSLRFIPGSLRLRPLLQPPPRTAEDAQAVRRDVEAIRLYTGTLVSADGKAAAIQVGIPDGTDRVRLLGALRRLAASYATPQLRIDVLGAPAAEALLGHYILEDLGVRARWLGLPSSPSTHPATALGWIREARRWIGLVPLALALMCLVFFLFFRRALAVVLPLIQILASLAAVFGVMGWTGSPIYLTTAVLPIILIASGVADSTHIFSRFAQERGRDPALPSKATVDRVMDDIWRPIVNTSVTTALGFAAFAPSPIPPVRTFGIFTALGIVYCLFLSFTAIPAMLALWGGRGRWRLAAEADGKRRSPIVAFGVWTYRRPVLALGLGALAAALLPFGMSRLVVQDSWIGGFAPASAFRQATDDFNHRFLGVHVLAVAVDGPAFTVEGLLTAGQLQDHAFPIPADSVQHPEALVGCMVELLREETMAESRLGSTWNSTVESVERVGDTVWVHTPRIHGSARFLWGTRPEEPIRYRVLYRPFLDPALLARLDGLGGFLRAQGELAVGGLLTPGDFLATTRYIVRGRVEAARRLPEDAPEALWLWEQYGRTRGQKRLHEVVDPEYGRVLIPVFLKHANFVDTARLLERIRTYEREQLAPHGLTLSFAGDVAVSQALIRAIVTTQVRSFALSLLGILATTVILFRSVRWGLFGAVPCTLATGMNFAIMGGLGIPLGVATSMFAGMTLGIGVDFATHLIEHFRVVRKRGLDPEAATRDAFVTAGPGVVANAVAVGGGLAVLCFSQVPANAWLGLLAAVGIFTSLLATFVLLPAFFRLFPRP